MQTLAKAPNLFDGNDANLISRLLSDEAQRLEAMLFDPKNHLDRVHIETRTRQARDLAQVFLVDRAEARLVITRIV